MRAGNWNENLSSGTSEGLELLCTRTGRRAVWVWLACCTVFLSVSFARADKAYTVRRGDTLSGIAKREGVPLDRLAARNGLKNYNINAGQRLIIPTERGTVKRTAGVLPSGVQRAITAAPVKPGRWKRIVIHHSGVNTGTVKGMDRYHREVRHMENGLAYHFVIGGGNGMANGEVAVGNRWTRQLDGGHLASESQNRNSIGICLVGNFDQHKPTEAQIRQLTALVEALLKRCHLKPDAVKTHQQVNIIGTRCPGRHFPTQTFLKSLK